MSDNKVQVEFWCSECGEDQGVQQLSEQEAESLAIFINLQVVKGKADFHIDENLCIVKMPCPNCLSITELSHIDAATRLMPWCIGR